MSHRTLLAAALALLATALPTVQADEPQSGEGLPWAKTYADALKQARQDKKLVMVDVFTEWCSWCKVLDKETYPDPKVIKAAEPYVGVKLDAEKEGEGKEFAAKYKVQAFPTIMFLDPGTTDDDAKVEAKVMGYMPPGPFADKLGVILAAHNDLPILEKQLSDHPDDLEALGKLTAIRAGRQEDKVAVELLDRGLKLDPENSKGLLTKGLNALGDRSQEEQEFDRAIVLFRKAAKSTQNPVDAAYAQSSVAMCLLSQDKLTEAIPELEAVAKIQGAPAEAKEEAEKLLGRVKAAVAKMKADGEKKSDETKDGDAKDKDKDKSATS